MFVAFRNTCGFSLLAFERLTAAPQSQTLLTNKDINKKALIPKNQGFFLVVTPTGFEPVMRAHNAERARKSIMPRSAATQGAAP